MLLNDGASIPYCVCVFIGLKVVSLVAHQGADIRSNIKIHLANNRRPWFASKEQKFKQSETKCENKGWNQLPAASHP